ncbi:hypothetical protein PG993_004424 [Apiospora rasikravindrae]|uniref:Uncharacterized protein n=1 Tax=Apiospora rasikravindrae TaxID=990691 RepID=A0ABR1TCP4_9PEZI
MADLPESKTSRKRGRETDERMSNPPDAPVFYATKKKMPQRAATPTYTAEDALKNFSPDDLKSLVERALRDQATKARMEEKIFATSNRIGERIAIKILEDSDEANARASAMWPSYWGGPFAEAEKLAWQTLISVLRLCVDEWEADPEDDFDDGDQDEVEEFHDLAQDIMLSIWNAQHRVPGLRKWLDHPDRRKELDDLRDDAEFSREERYEKMIEFLENGY